MRVQFAGKAARGIAVSIAFFVAAPAAAQGLKPPAAAFAVQAIYTRPEGDLPGELFVIATVADNYHVYSIAQPQGGPPPTRIKIAAQGAKAGDFIPLVPPATHVEPLFDNLAVEEHAGAVVWRAPLEFDKNVAAEDAVIEGTLTAQACNESSCLPPRTVKFKAILAERGRWPPKNAGKVPQADPHANVMLTGLIVPGPVTPGKVLSLAMTATPDAGYALLQIDDGDDKNAKVLKPEIEFVERRAFPPANEDAQAVGKVPADGKTIPRPSVLWLAFFNVPADAAVGEHLVLGKFHGWPPKAAGGDAQHPNRSVNFAVFVPVGGEAKAGEPGMLFWRDVPKPAAPVRGAANGSR